MKHLRSLGTIFPQGSLRRHLLASAIALASVTAMPASSVLAQEIRAVMHSGLRVLDPIITTAHITRNHGYMIYDTLLAVDENQAPQPQMADWTVSDDGMAYTFTLRDGLKFHDGADVTAADVVASLKRWAERDGGGQMLMGYTKSIEATGDKTAVLTLSEPFSYVIELIAKPSAVPAFIMPERIASTPGTEAVAEHIGSGPFRFVEAEYEPGVRVVYEKFADYVPRSEPASWTAGGKEVKVDRVVWVSMPDAQTALNALTSGEIDYIEQPPIDLLPLLEGNEEITVDVLNTLGYQTMGRLNWLHAPFDDVRVRRAAMLALNQTDVLGALIGNPEYYSVCASMYGCDTPLATDAGGETMVEGSDVEGAKALLEEAGYDGTPIVLMQPTDVSSVSPQPVVAAQLLRQAGFTVDLQPMDWQTLVTRRASQAAPADGGWNMFFTNWVIPEVWNPIINPMLNGGGTEKAWFGWPDDPELEAMRKEFVQATNDDDRQEIATRLHQHAYEVVNYIPLGQYLSPSAWRNELSGVRKSPVPLFWDITKAE
ncbi:ABC transporter substrate-binding protein [Aurantimonas endophytica]|uniref:Peptide/nickel transport system substrate-binding protein n=1 Tax=Aurantimonas endophytica TaxID=1522175 RepID=A0A7W6HDG9_9HYPH|nr:peptide/nickel transport system substrate-binding protein [Aurantimonas endophytica]MCO6403925.1 ABC transporter substrate-binding protein [Aurantimonas endophytica]